MAVDRPSPEEEPCESDSGPDLPKWPASRRRPRTTTFRARADQRMGSTSAGRLASLAKAPSSLLTAATAAPAPVPPAAEVAAAASSLLEMHNNIFQEIEERFALLSSSGSGSQPPPVAKQGYLSSSSQAADTPKACAHLNSEHCPNSLAARSSHLHYRCASHNCLAWGHTAHMICPHTWVGCRQ